MSQSKLHSDYECTRACRSREHGSILTSAITKRAVSDAALASFCRHICQNFLRVLDVQGRSIIHMAASRGRRLLLEWLLKHCPSNQQGVDIIDLKDLESGYTALHRSIFYGQLHTAIALIKHGANPSHVDNEDTNSIDLALLDRHARFDISKNYPCEVYMWGANTNYTLGISSQQQRNFPELLNAFTKQNKFIKHVCLSKFHGVFVTSDGEVWSCGHGEGGRLGIATSDTRVTPTRVPLAEPCVQTAVGRDHTLFLLHSGTILSCGLNDYHQLGQLPAPKSQLSPTAVKLRLSAIKGVFAARYHSIAFNARTVYTWGLNGGQLGHAKEDGKFITSPKKVLSIGSNNDEYTIDSVATSDGATAVTTSKGDIFVIHQFQCKRIAFRLHNIKYVKVVGGEVIGGDKLTDQQKLVSVLMLNTVGNIYLWQETSSQFIRCIYNITRPFVVTEAVLTRESILIVTKNGEAFQGNIMPRKVASIKPRPESTDDYSPQTKDKGGSGKSFHQFIDKDECYMLKLKRIPNVHRAVDICCDSKANNFGILQVVPNACLIDLPQVTSSQIKEDLLSLLEEASESDMLHDVIIKVDKVRYAAHRYILTYGSEHFSKLLRESGDDNIPMLTIENVHPLIFKQILLYLYTGSCDLLNPGPCNIKIDNDKGQKNDAENEEDIYIINDNISAYEHNMKNKTRKGAKKEKSKKAENVNNSLFCDPVRLLQAATKKLGINSLYKILDKFGWNGENVIIRYADKKYETVEYRFDQNAFTELYDTHIRCSDGQIIKAHKCILAARLEYFNGMFGHTWMESSKCSTISLHINKRMLSPIIQFLYSDECPELENCDDFEFISNMLIICDQFFITRMREMCEAALANMLTLKNAPDILRIADLYNCPQLKNCCMEYISLNLSSFLENKSLECIPLKLAEQLSEYYCNFNPLVMGSRVITPFSDAPIDEVIMSCAETSPVDFDQNLDDELLKDIEQGFSSLVGRKKSRPRKTSTSENEKTPKRDSDRNDSIGPIIERVADNKEKTETNSEEWTKVSNNPKQKVVLARLKAVTRAKENVDIFNVDTNTYTKLNGREQQTIRSPDVETFRRLSENDVDEELPCRSPKMSLNITLVNPKLSQKQRKRLLSENGSIASAPPVCEDDRVEPTSPKNPWNKIEARRDSSSPDARPTKFTEILEDQRKQRENLTKMMTKSLRLTQIEDKAIQELTKHYNSIAEKGERVRVERVSCGRAEAPRWIDRSFKGSGVVPNVIIKHV